MVFSVGDNISDTGNMRFVASKLESIKKSIEKYKRAKTELSYTDISRKNPNIEKGKLNFIRYSEMKNWSVRELFGEDLEQADRALINKVYHMLFDIGSDFESVIRMLYSFRNGPKSGIKVADPEDNYEWTNKDGNEKYSTKNLPKAHFRWDWRRYTLSKESVDKITEFVDTILES